MFTDTDSVFNVLTFTKASLDKFGPDMRPHAPYMFKLIEEVLNRDVFRAPNVLIAYRDDPVNPEDKNGPIRVEYEKLCAPYYQSDKKKNYFYVDCDLDTGATVFDKQGNPSIKVTGGQGKKRDMPPIVGLMESSFVKAIVGDSDTSAEGIAERIRGVARGWIGGIVNDMIPWENYVASTKLTKDASRYDTENQATVLSRKISQRDPSRHVAVGDRFPYLIIHPEPGSRSKQKRDLCEDPGYVINNGIDVNREYILRNVVGNIFNKFLAIAGLQGIQAQGFIDGCIGGGRSTSRLRPRYQIPPPAPPPTIMDPGPSTSGEVDMPGFDELEAELLAGKRKSEAPPPATKRVRESGMGSIMALKKVHCPSFPA